MPEPKLEKVLGVWMLSWGTVCCEINPNDPEFRDEIRRLEHEEALRGQMSMLSFDDPFEKRS